MIEPAATAERLMMNYFGKGYYAPLDNHAYSSRAGVGALFKRESLCLSHPGSVVSEYFT